MTQMNSANPLENQRAGVLVLEDREHPDGLAFDGYLFGAPAGSDEILAAQKAGGSAGDRGYGEVV